MINLMNGDCLEKLKLLNDNSIDSIVTDPPYGLAFMGKKWDYDVPSVEIWKECLRVLKPGGHLLSFGGTRTYHRMVINIEDAGFEIRDQIMWIYGSGFPKSMDISKAIDKQAGAIREQGAKKGYKSNLNIQSGNLKGAECKSENYVDAYETIPATESAKQWEGWGTALKPANEPICLARKPISEKTVASNVLKHGAGAMNIDESRIEADQKLIDHSKKYSNYGESKGEKSFHGGIGGQFTDASQGRWPANVIFDEEAGKILDEQSGVLKSGAIKKEQYKDGLKNEIYGKFGGFELGEDLKANQGGASRFFYCAKSSKAERGNENIHPTVKPIKLMTYLIKLITPPGGIVLDPFMGSGSTGVAARELGFKFVGIERDAAYFEIASKRIDPVEVSA